MAISPEQQPNGNWKFRERYKDPSTGKWKSVTVTYEKNTTHTRKMAQKELDKKIEEKLKKAYSNEKEYTMKELGDLYLEKMKGVLKYDSTYPNRIKIIKRLTILFGEDTLINTIDPIQLETILINEHLRKYGKVLFGWAFNKGLTKRNLAGFIDNRKREVTYEEWVKKESKIEYLERDEVNSLFDKLSNSEIYNEMMLRFILEFQLLTCKRFGEITPIYESDVKDNTVAINKRYYRGSINLPKTKKSISVLGINNRAMQIKSEAIFLKRMYGINSEFLFANKKGNPFFYETARRTIKKYGLPGRTHLFRHTAVSLLAEDGVPLQYIQDRVGHESDKTTTQIYMHVTKKMQKKQQEYFQKIDIL